MPLTIFVVLSVLAVLILAGPALEEIIDRIWPPTEGPADDARPRRHSEPTGRAG